ncbi:amidohydrolase-domain-containing protein [Irpex rosettiformis]|uniref:Amidohydrolase-domain-containing protein n=1 Tax=Irpex rosettiformis TaxID=378272 RepID=A0ACB8TU62_9APHY|nr:amidohydrolase-domain-containing protein [Irpex rosettiformis]
MDPNDSYPLPELAKVALTFPAIDNHAHPLLRESHRDAFAFEGLISEATGEALTKDAVNTVACFRATLQLGKLFYLENKPSWETIKNVRREMAYEQLCRNCMEPSHIQCILFDDGLGGVTEFSEDYKWHDKFTSSPSKRIVRVEILAEGILEHIFDDQLSSETVNGQDLYFSFRDGLLKALQDAAEDVEVVGFKSIACYRTGLNITVFPSVAEIMEGLKIVHSQLKATRKLRLETKAVNDFVVNATLDIAGQYGKPVQFHTGLGDNDITLSLSSPSHMQPIIKAHPTTKFILLHSSYPYTRDAGYLTAVYPNVFLDFGEIFPFLSPEGQANVIKQVLELCPTNKILWSTDGHWWPESYYLGSIQAREALLRVLTESVQHKDMSEAQAIKIVKNALFYNANRVYNLGLEPQH